MARTEYAKRSVLCPCGGDIYRRSLNDTLQRTWTCGNCGRETPRVTRSAKTNKSRALDTYKRLRAGWEPIDIALGRLVDTGRAKSGALLAHASTFNTSLNSLLDNDHPTRIDITVAVSMSRDAMARATAFIAQKESV